MPGTNKTDYKKFLEKNQDAPIYIQDWYLDIVCGEEKWDSAIVKKSDEVIAVLPYYIKSNRLFTWIAMPPLSKLHGPHILPEFHTNRYHHGIIDELLDQLPKVSFYHQATDYSFKNWLPYLWRGFNQVTLYSYIYPKIDTEIIFQNIKSDVRRKIKMNVKDLHLKSGLSFDLFYEIFTKTYKRQGLNPPFSFDFLNNYYTQLKGRSAAEILYVVDNNEILHTAALLIWDKKTCYYIIEASDPTAPNKYGPAVMKWMTIKYVKETLNLDRFDFEGSISQRIERTYREFGAIAEPYYVIKKYYSKPFLGLKFMQNYRQYGKLAQW